MDSDVSATSIMAGTRLSVHLAPFCAGAAGQRPGEPRVRMLGRSTAAGTSPATRGGRERSGMGHRCRPRARRALVAAGGAGTPADRGGGRDPSWMVENLWKFRISDYEM